ALGQEGVAGTARGRWQGPQDYPGRAAPRPVGALTAGARTLRLQLAALVGQPVPGLLDGSPLDKTVAERMSMVARHKQEKAAHVAHLLAHRNPYGFIFSVAGGFLL